MTPTNNCSSIFTANSWTLFISTTNTAVRARTTSGGGLRSLINWVCDNWRQKDHGIWEVQSGPQHFLYSKVMCWVALDRATRLADKRSFPADRERWFKVRDEIYEEIHTRGWNEEKHAFVQHYDGDALDAATLIMPLVFFMTPTDPKMLSTIDS